MQTCTVYVGMALTEAPPEFRDGFQKELKDGLRSLPHLVILDFIGIDVGNDIQVFQHDQRCTLEADLCLFIVDHPSTGLGMEIAIRYIAKKPFLVFAKRGKRVTRMLTGALRVRGESVTEYDTVDDIVTAVRKLF